MAHKEEEAVLSVREEDTSQVRRILRDKVGVGLGWSATSIRAHGVLSVCDIYQLLDLPAIDCCSSIHTYYVKLYTKKALRVSTFLKYNYSKKGSFLNVRLLELS